MYHPIRIGIALISNIPTDLLTSLLSIHSKYNSTNPDHLWNAITSKVHVSATGLKQPLKNAMETWTKQPGYPVVQVNVSRGILSLNQKRFLISNPENIAINVTWSIPLTWTTHTQPNFQSTKPNYWFTTENDNVNIESGDDEWVIVNVQQSGMYTNN